MLWLLVACGCLLLVEAGHAHVLWLCACCCRSVCVCHVFSFCLTKGFPLVASAGKAHRCVHVVLLLWIVIVWGVCCIGNACMCVSQNSAHTECPHVEKRSGTVVS